MDDDDDFYDTISVNSRLSKRSNNKDYFSLSTNTLYQSTIDVMELENLTNQDSSASVNNVNQVATNSKAVTYSQWRDRVYFLKNCYDHSLTNLNCMLSIYLMSTLPGCGVCLVFLHFVRSHFVRFEVSIHSVPRPT